MKCIETLTNRLCVCFLAGWLNLPQSGACDPAQRALRPRWRSSP